MEPIGEDFSNCTAMVVDGNINSRSILVTQLRDLGIRQIVQCIRTADARRRLELQEFDFVLCESQFDDERTSGQELLDDLRRNQLLPFTTVFFMVTGEATYTKVAEAAESALDGYLLKPHKATQLEERLLLARARKKSLQVIFDAINAQDFERAIDLCLTRFRARGQFWLFSARVGAELMLRLGRYDEAQSLYESAMAFRPLPWTRLGIARAQLESGKPSLACTALLDLLQLDPTNADACDLLWRAQFELGQLNTALATCQLAANLTPSSINRVQSAAMLSYYCGQTDTAERLLDSCTRLGLESKLFDAQTLVLLAVTRLELENRRGLQRCVNDIARLVEHEPDNRRLKRLAFFIDLCGMLQRHDPNAAQTAITTLAQEAMDSEFDFESAANLIAVLTHMRAMGMFFKEVEPLVQTLALRFCSSRTATDMLSACAHRYAPYQEWIKAANNTVLGYVETALAQARDADPTRAIVHLLMRADASLNVRLIDNALQLLRKHADQIESYDALMQQAQTLHQRAGAGNRKLTLGRPMRQPGGMLLRVGNRSAASQRVVPHTATPRPTPTPTPH